MATLGPHASAPPVPEPVPVPAVLFAAAYFAGALLGSRLSLSPGNFANFWPPSGIFVAVLLVSQRRRWPVLVAAAVMANICFDLWNGKHWGVTLLFPVANSLEALLGAWLVLRCTGGKPALATVRDVTCLVVLSAALSTVVGASIGAAIVTSLLGGNSYGQTWVMWWSGNAVGILLFAPLVLVWLPRMKRPADWKFSLETAKAVAYLTLLSLATLAIFGGIWTQPYPLKYLLFPLVLWVAMRFEMRGITVANLLIALIAAWASVLGYHESAIANLAPVLQVITLQLFLSVTVIVGLFIAVTISERRSTEKKLAEKSRYYETLLQTSRDAIHILDQEGRLCVWNNAFLAHLGYSPEEASTLKLADWDLQWNGAQLAAKIQALKDRGEVFETTHRRRDGTLRSVEINAVGIQIGGADFLYASARDISERKRAEESLNEKTRQLEELNLYLEQRVAAAVTEMRKKDQLMILQSRQAAMGEMIGNIAHQWRQPLNTLGLVVQELLLTYGREEFNKENLEASVRKSMELITHMSRTINDFSTYFKPCLEKTQFSVNQAVTKTLLLAGPSLKSLNIAIKVIARDEAEITGYPNEYAQVLLNILLNCRDAFAERRSGGQPLITVTVTKENSRSVVTIADNAGGIPEDIVDKVFDPYFTTKGPDKGTGIGLYMAKTIIEKNMGGRLTVRNQADGAEFRIEV